VNTIILDKSFHEEGDAKIRAYRLKNVGTVSYKAAATAYPFEITTETLDHFAPRLGTAKPYDKKFGPSTASPVVLATCCVNPLVEYGEQDLPPAQARKAIKPADKQHVIGDPAQLIQQFTMFANSTAEVSTQTMRVYVGVEGKIRPPRYSDQAQAYNQIITLNYFMVDELQRPIIGGRARVMRVFPVTTKTA
jgi:hypothetical protein